MKNKGFTLVELLAVIVILGLLIGIGVYTVNNIKDSAEKNYYVTMEDTLKIAGNDYFNDNREDRPIDDYNFVSLETLEEHSYLEPLKTYDKKENCDKSSGVYIYNTDDGNEYEVCLKCGIHQSDGLYCNGKKTGQIDVTGKTNTGAYYNPILSYVGTPWVNASSVFVTFTLMGKNASTDMFKIYDGNTNKKVYECKPDKGKNFCTQEISVTGSYFVVAYKGEEKVGNRKYFNVKIDNIPPTFEFKDNEKIKELENNYEYEYFNEVINIHDDNGYKSVVFSLRNLDNDNSPVNVTNKDLTSTNLQILEKLPSGRYKLSAMVIDYAQNIAYGFVDFKVMYNVNLVYFDNNEKKHDIGIISVHTNGFYNTLPNKVTIDNKTGVVEWYDNTNFTGSQYDSSTKVSKTSTHTLYGREKRDKIPSISEPHCNNNNDFTYNGKEQELVTAKIGYHLTNNVQINAGTYTIIAMPDANYTWEDGTRTYKLISCTIKPYAVDFKPSDAPCRDNLIYEAEYQNLVQMDGHYYHTGASQASYRLQWNTGDIFTVYPYVGKDAGNYDVKYHLLSSNFVWNDGTNADHVYHCSIGKYPAKFPGECSASYAGLTNQGGHSEGLNFEVFAGERRTIFAKPREVNSANDSLYVSDVYFSDFALPGSNFKESNYYIAETPIDCKITPRLITIFAGSSKKVYDGTPLTNNTYTEKENISTRMGDTISSIKFTGSITYVGTTDNIPSNVIVRSGDKDVTKYYNFAYEKGTLEVTPRSITVKARDQSKEYDKTALNANGTCDITSGSLATKDEITCTCSGSQKDVGSSKKKLTSIKIKNKSGVDVTSSYNISYENDTPSNGTLSVVDTKKPKCTLSISSDGTITAKPEDNYKLAYYGFSSSYSGTNTKTKKVTKSGTTKYYVKDTSGNKNTCTITYEKVKQQRIAKCNKYKSCPNNLCSCKTYNSCEASSCGCYERYSCVASACGCKSWSDWSSYDCCYSSDLTSSNNTTQNQCRPSLLLNGLYKCRTRTCKEYNSCQNDSCNCKTYNSCPNSSCGCKERKSCEDSSCGCNTWGGFGNWSDNPNCKAGEASNHQTKTECQTIFRKK